MSNIGQIIAGGLKVGGSLWFGVGTGGTNYPNVHPEGMLYVDVTPGGNGADTTEDVLATFSLPPNVLANVGDGVRIIADFILAANADTKTSRLYFGSEVIATPAAASNNVNARLELEVFKTGVNTQIIAGCGVVGTTMVAPLNTTGAETDTAAITIKATGQAGAGNANDIQITRLTVEVIKAPL